MRIKGISIIIFMMCLSFYGHGQVLPLDVLLLAEINTDKNLFTSPYQNPQLNAVASPSYDAILQKTRFKAEELPLFCRMEHQLAKKSKVNFKFRLGSVDYVDRLEGK